MRHARKEERCERQDQRDAEIGEVEERHGARAVGDRRRGPPAHEPQPSRPRGLERRRHDEGDGHQVRGEEDRGVPRCITIQQPAAGDDPGEREQRHDGEEEEVERREERAEQAGQADQPRPVAPAVARAAASSAGRPRAGGWPPPGSAAPPSWRDGRGAPCPSPTGCGSTASRSATGCRSCCG